MLVLLNRSSIVGGGCLDLVWILAALRSSGNLHVPDASLIVLLILNLHLL